jgi:exosortase A
MIAEGTTPSSPWRQAGLAVLLLLALVLVLYRETVVSMITIWERSDTFAHAFLVLPIVLWLVWRRRQSLALQMPRPALCALPAIAAVAVAWLMGQLVAVNSVTQLALVAMLVLAVPAVLGLRIAKLLLFPLAFLFFAVPIGEFMMPTLINWTADFTVIALRLTGIPVYREGNQLAIPSGTWSVVEACSGVRYLIASFMVGTLFAYLNYRSTRRRVIFAVIALLVPVLANWLRAYMIVMLAHLSDNKLAVGVDHLIYGWVFFGIVMAILFVIGARWSEPDAPQSEMVPAISVDSQAASGTAVWAVTLGAMLLVAAPQGALWAIERSETSLAPRLELPAELAPGWRASDAQLGNWQPAFEGPSVQGQRVYENGEQSVGLYIAYYRRQGENHKLVSSQNVLVSSQDKLWNQLASGSRNVAVASDTLKMRTALLQRAQLPGEAERLRLMVWRLYWVNGTWTSSDYVAKLAGAWHRLRGQGDESAEITVYTVENAPGGADLSLNAFLSANLGAIESVLRAARASGEPK